MGNNYYVYEHIRLDNMTCFYVGKGKGNRAYLIGRNNHHDKIANKAGYAVVIIKENLTEKEAHQLEKDLIDMYVYELGYGINIKGYRNYADRFYLTNATFGGEGCSGRTFSIETRNKISKSNKGKKRSEYDKMVGRWCHLGIRHTEETKRKIGLASIGRNSGSSNWQAKKVVCLNTKEVFETATDASKKYNLHVANIISCCRHNHNKKFTGILNGEHLVWVYYEEYIKMTKEEKESCLKDGLKNKNHQSHKIICITTNKKFNSIEEAKEFYNMKSGSGIGHCLKKERKTAGTFQGEKLKWEYQYKYDKVVNYNE